MMVSKSLPEPIDDDPSSSSDETRTGEPSDGDEAERGGNKEATFTANETKAVTKSKILVYVVLLLAAAAVGTATYFFTNNDEQQVLQSEFYAYSRKVDSAANGNAVGIFSQLKGMSATITSYALEDNVTWPYVTLPNFDRRAQEMEESTSVRGIIFAPIVTDIEEWEVYATNHQAWIKTDMMYRGVQNPTPDPIPEEVFPFWVEWEVEDNKDEEEEEEGRFVPLWQLGPVPSNVSIINLDLYTHEQMHQTMERSLVSKKLVLSDIVDISFLLGDQYEADHHGEPRGFVLQPIFDDLTEDANVVAFLIAILRWEIFFDGILPEGLGGLIVDIHSTCDSEFSYHLVGPRAEYVSSHEDEFHTIEATFPFAESARFIGDVDAALGLEGRNCDYEMTVHATAEFVSYYTSNRPVLYTVVVVLVFVFTAMVFALYDYTVYRRQTKLLGVARRTDAIVASLFPREIQDRLEQHAEFEGKQERQQGRSGLKNKLQDFLNEDGSGMAPRNNFDSQPIADLWPEVTIMFADIVGFTAWSSVREPSQVFTLLESIFREFDSVAARRRVFKVETVGDCYVAVAGLPQPRKDHAVVMARFANDCLCHLKKLMEQLEVRLGPETTELGMRFGLHSGPVTAGVLRGDKARFQLFGDAMNTTARIEATGERNRIHISQETARLLQEAGKHFWVIPREGSVVAKGKGELTTYWLQIRGDTVMSSLSGSSSEGAKGGHGKEDATVVDQETTAENPEWSAPLPDKHLRLVQWNTDLLAKSLREVVARRQASGLQPDADARMKRIENEQLLRSEIVLEEVQDILELPKFDPTIPHDRVDSDFTLNDAVLEQLHRYMTMIAAMYRDNPFHNFEHASHVTMSVVKLLSRIVAPEIKLEGNNPVEKDLHDHTYGITSDPLTQFASILAAVIHDVDHTGVPNSQLVNEQASIAAVYKGKSVAEQNSVDIAWELLMQDGFMDLRQAIYTTGEEFVRFRQLLVNCVMATDIMDKDLASARKERWNKAFSEGVIETEDQAINRKATIVLEYLMQASDVSHTMQHWHIYRKWNARLFQELYKAYIVGRSDRDPSDIWFEGEKGFFDHYIIPLAHKLRSCGVFGVSSDEYLDYARHNRLEWENKGEEIVAELKANALAEFGPRK